MISNRNPMKDQVAIAGAATTGFVSRNSGKSPAALAADACTRVLRECDLSAADVDGLCGGSGPLAPQMQSMLGIPEVTWFSMPSIPFVNQIAAAASAVHSGLCDVVLAYHVPYRMPYVTASSLKDPFRPVFNDSYLAATGLPMTDPGPETIGGAVGYAAWASRYLYEYGARKETFGYVAINSRSNAALNPAAGKRDPITMDDYLSARMIRWPLCMLDMDLPVDGADAFVITTPERARDLPLRPVLINACTMGIIDKNEEDQMPSLARNGQHVVVEALKRKSDIWIDGADVCFLYDGFTNITLGWLENLGFCKPGEAGDFIEANWDKAGARLLIDGRIPVNTHGGALSEGATQGSGYVREAVHQLQGLAGERQVAGAETTLITVGGFFLNAQGLTLRAD